MIRSTLSTFTKHTMGRVRRRTSTKQRSIALVVRSLRHAQPDRAQPGHEIPLVVAVAVGLPPAAPPRTGFPHRIAVPLPPRFLFQQTLPGQLGLAVHIPPETFLPLRQKMLVMLGDWDYLRHRVQVSFSER